jgi:aminoglycoside 6'-N-acetyltransferase I
MPEVVCRILRPDDLAALARVADGVLDRAVDEAQARALLADAAHVLAVAEDGDQVVGALLAVVARFPDKPPELWVNEIGVADRWQGQGIGRALMRLALHEARARGCVAAWVAADRTEQAMGFYRALAGEEEAGISHFTWRLDPSG